MKKAQAEIRSYVGMKPYVDESELENLHYLKMVVKETLWLHPPGTLLLPREVMSHFKIGDYDINPKTRILIYVWAIGRDPNTWKNPNEFYPESLRTMPLILGVKILDSYHLGPIGGCVQALQWHRR